VNNQVIIKDPALLKEGARSYADLPGGHSEGYDETFKQVFRRFYASIENPGAEAGVSAVCQRSAAVDHFGGQNWRAIAAMPGLIFDDDHVR
jgi:hypothetical protein